MVSPQRTSLEQALSAVMDGRATEQEWTQVDAAWAHDPALRERWAAWQTAADGLCSSDLLAPRPGHEDLLGRLHAGIPAPAPATPRRREWLAPFAVAAGFFAVALGVTRLPPATPADAGLVAARQSTVPMQGLVGTSFAQTAAGRTLTPDVAPAEVAWPSESSPEWLDWSAPSADAGASSPQP